MIKTRTAYLQFLQTKQKEQSRAAPAPAPVMQTMNQHPTNAQPPPNPVQHQRNYPYPHPPKTASTDPAAFSTCLNRIRAAISVRNLPQRFALPGRPILTAQYLYCSGFSNSILTCCETAVLLDAIRRGHVAMGIRLLCPRYSPEFIYKDFERNICQNAILHINVVPTLSDSLWNALMLADYKRSLTETGAIVCTEGNYSYKAPMEILPMDRFFERHFLHSGNSQQNAFVKSWVFATARPCLAALKLDQKESRGGGRRYEPQQQQPMQPNYNAATVYAPVHNPVMQNNPSLPANVVQNASFQPIANAVNPGKTGLVDLTADEEEQNHASFALPTQAQTNLPPERIRGGNPGDALNSTPSTETTQSRTSLRLSNYSPNTWLGKAVFGKCLTTKDESLSGEAKMIGFVTSIYKMQALVKVFHVSNAGYLPSPVSRYVGANELFIIMPGTAEAEIARVWKNWTDKEKKENSGVNQQVQPGKAASPVATPRNSANIAPASNRLPSRANETSDQYRKVPAKRSMPSYAMPNHSTHPISKSNSAQLLVDRLSQKMRNLPLGFLPDGRALFWYKHDPSSLYVRTDNYFYHPNGHARAAHEEAQRRYRILLKRATKKKTPSILHPCPRGRYHCLWGCSESRQGSQDRYALSFLKLESVTKHNILHHSFCDEDLHKEDSLDLRRWIRIPEGELIQWLCADLTAAICARSLSLQCYTGLYPATEHCCQLPEKEKRRFCHSPLPERAMFQLDQILEFTDAGKGSVKFAAIDNVRHVTNVEIRGFLRLWSRIGRLFVIDDSGLFRLGNKVGGNDDTNGAPIENLDEHEEQKEANVDNANKVDKSGGSDEKVTKETFCSNKCCLYNPDAWKSEDVFKNSLSCNICALENEKISNTSSAEDEEGDNCTQYTPLGCALATAVSFPDLPMKEAGEDMQKEIEKWMQEKASLGQLEILKILLLKVASAVSSTHLQTKEVCIWQMPFLSTWIAFVSNCVNARMLMQALITLMKSVNLSKMPKWWTAARGGWVGVAAIMQVPTFDNFAMQLYIFDLAVAECIATSEKNKGGQSKAAGTPTTGEEIVQQHRSSYLPHVSLSASKSEEFDSALKKLMSMNLENRMKSILKLADYLELKRFDGISNDDCYICNQGGDLMCCEFCNLVVHIECCRDPLTQLPDFDWACDDCVSDILKLRIYKEKT